MQRIKILFIITGLAQGGAEAMLYKVLAGIDRERFELSIISLHDEGVWGAKIRQLEIPVYCLNIANSTSRFLGGIRFVSLVKKIKPQIIQGWMYHGNLFAMLAKTFSWKSRIIFNIRQSLNDIENEKKMTRWIIKFNAKLSIFADKVINNSQCSMKQHQSFGFCKNNMIYIGNGIDQTFFKPSHDLRQRVQKSFDAQGSKFLGMIARFHPMKNHLGFLEVAVLIKNQCVHRVKFLMAGQGVDFNNPVLTKRIEELELQNDIILLGPVKSQEYMPALDLLLLPSSWGEGFPNVLAEALACGVPCVATDVGDCREVIGACGAVVPVGDMHALALKVEEILALSPEDSRRLSLACRKRAVEKFSIEHVIQQYEQLYDHVMSDKRVN